jgi:hypothetical protein
MRTVLPAAVYNEVPVELMAMSLMVVSPAGQLE